MTAPLVIEVEVTALPVQVEVASTSAIVTAGPPVAVLVAVPGPRGIQGLPGTGAPIVGETPSGVKDGANLVFTTDSPYRAGTLAVYRNGLREVRGIGFTETSSTTVTFSDPPSSYDDITVDYVI